MQQIWLILLSVWAVSALSVCAQEKSVFSRMDVFALEFVSQPKISPDGRRIVYVRNRMDIMTDVQLGSLWIIGADGSGHVKLTNREGNEGYPHWSPDGTRIAFIGDTESGPEIFLYTLSSGEVRCLSQLERSPKGLSWSPDGTQLAFSMLVSEPTKAFVSPPAQPDGATWASPPRVTQRLKYESNGAGFLEPGFSHHFVIPSVGGAHRQITNGNFHHGEKRQWTGHSSYAEGPQWTADGEGLVFSANRNLEWERDFINTEIYQVSTSKGKMKALTERKGLDANPVMSPDGQWIAYLGYADKVQAYQTTKLHVMKADGTEKRVLTAALDRSVSGPIWSHNSHGLYVKYDDQGNTKIAYVPLSGDINVLANNLGGALSGRPYGRGSFSVANNGTIAYTYSTAQHPAELALVNKFDRKPELITSVNGDLLSHRELGAVEEIWYQSSIDKRDIQGWIVKPPGFDDNLRYPLIVENHGGPISNYGDRFSTEIQLYAAAGYVVFYPNPRGSTSYGEEFGNLLHNNYPGEDYQDVMDGVDAMIATGYIEPSQLFVTGSSAGGTMTAWIIGKTDRFRAAAVVRPVTNLYTNTLTADNYYEYENYFYSGRPWENMAAYMGFSPITLVGKVQSPTMVMVGLKDLRTPPSQAKQLYSALQMRKIETALVEFPDAAHRIYSRPSRLIAKVDHILAWFEKYR